MKHIRLLIGLLFITMIYACQTESSNTSLDDIEVGYRNDLPLCESIAVDFSEEISDCCIFSFGITFPGSTAPKILINGQAFSDFDLSAQGVVIFQIETCSDEETILEIIGSDENGNEVVCETHDLTCNTCCAATALFSFFGSNNSDTGECFYEVTAENESDCDYTINVNGVNSGSLPPGASTMFDVNQSGNNPPTIVSLINEADDSVCKTETFECGPCCDFGGEVLANVSGPELSGPGCCTFRVRVRNLSECAYELHQDGAFVDNIPAGNTIIQIGVEVCGFGPSNIDIVSPTAGTNYVCIAFELEATCSE